MHKQMTRREYTFWVIWNLEKLNYTACRWWYGQVNMPVDSDGFYTWPSDLWEVRREWVRDEVKHRMGGR